MFRLIVLFVFMAVALFATESAKAQDFPEYDGVYLRLKNGEFVELPYSQRQGAHQLVFQARGKFQSQLNYGGIEGEMTYFSLDDFASSPIVDVSQIASIVVVGPAPRQLNLHPLVDARTKNEEYVNDPTGVVEHRFNGSSKTIRASEVPYLLTRQRCGYGSSKMRIRRVNQYITEYEPKQGTRWYSNMSLNRENGTCKDFARDADVMEVILDGQAFASFRTKTGTRAAESTNLAPPTAQVPVLASEESIEQTFSIIQSLIGSPCDATCSLEAGGALFEVAQTYPEGSHINNLKSVCALLVRKGQLTCVPTYLSSGDDWTSFRFFYVFQTSCPQCSVSFAMLRRDADLTATPEKVFGYLADYVTE